MSNIPSPYVVDRMNCVADLGVLDMHAAFEARREPDRSWTVDESSWRFTGHYLGAGVKGVLPAARLVARLRPDAVVSGYASPVFLSTIASARALRIPLTISVLKTFETWTRRRRSRERAKRFLFPRVNIQVSGPDSAAYARRYGARNHALTVIPEPVDVQRIASIADATRGTRVGVRRSDEVVFLYVGRLWGGKGIDFLLDAFSSVLAEGLTVSLVIAGDGEDEARLRRRATENGSTRFLGFVQADELPAVYGQADVFVFPTLGDPYGHVVQEAMAAGLPVISTSAAGDISDRVEDGATGLIVRPADARALAEAMGRLARDPGLRAAMGTLGRERISQRTNEWWARAFVAMVEELAGARAT